MDHAPALRLALDLMHFPSQVRVVRAAPLPEDLVVLLRIAAGEDEAIRQAMKMSGRSAQAVSDAAAFFIEQILLFPEADAYRVLGSGPEASNGELRRNMALLLRWLHPDLDRQGERAAFTARVTCAWNDLKTPERRAAYDRQMQTALAQKSLLRKKRLRRKQQVAPGRRRFDRPAGVGPYHRPRYAYLDQAPGGLLRRVLFSLFGRTVS